MRFRSLSAAVAAVIALAAPVAAARANTLPAASSPAPTRLTFVPPKVGPLSVSLGPTIIGGQVIDPGLNVSTPGVSLPPIVWTAG